MKVNELVNIRDNLVFVCVLLHKSAGVFFFQVQVALFMAFVILKVQPGHQIPLACIHNKN